MNSQELLEFLERAKDLEVALYKLCLLYTSRCV